VTKVDIEPGYSIRQLQASTEQRAYYNLKLKNRIFSNQDSKIKISILLGSENENRLMLRVNIEQVLL
jgi:hypothetical protein